MLEGHPYCSGHSNGFSGCSICDDDRLSISFLVASAIFGLNERFVCDDNVSTMSLPHLTSPQDEPHYLILPRCRPATWHHSISQQITSQHITSPRHNTVIQSVWNILKLPPPARPGTAHKKCACTLSFSVIARWRILTCGMRDRRNVAETAAYFLLYGMESRVWNSHVSHMIFHYLPHWIPNVQAATLDDVIAMLRRRLFFPRPEPNHHKRSIPQMVQPSKKWNDFLVTRHKCT